MQLSLVILISIVQISLAKIEHEKITGICASYYTSEKNILDAFLFNWLNIDIDIDIDIVINILFHA